MGDNSKIQWTDATWNCIRGCTKVSAGCKHCYAETFAERFRGVKGHPYEHGFDLRLVPEKLDEPLRWKKPRRIFVNSMSDLFHPDVPDEYIDRVWATMLLAPQHTFQVLTKRPERMMKYLSGSPYRYQQVLRWADVLRGDRRRLCSIGVNNPVTFPAKWLHLGVSVENQEAADERIPLLLQTPAAVRFLSIEPLLGMLDLSPWLVSHEMQGVEKNRITWVIVGGESGPKARPCNLDWIRSIVRQCKSAGVPCFVKQLGAHVFEPHDSCNLACLERFHFIPLRHCKGADPNEWPEDLRVREYPV